MPVEPIGPVVVGVDGSPASLAALDLAAEEAVGRVTPLVVVHAYDGEVDAPAKRLAAAAMAEALAEHPGLSVSIRLVRGEPARALAQASRRACLLVVGYHERHRRTGRGPAGLVAEQLIGRAGVPLVVHLPVDGGGEVALPRPVLVSVAGESDAEPLLAFAFDEASMRGAPLLAMHVWTAPDDPSPTANLDGHGAALALLNDTVARWSDKYPDVAVHTVARRSLDVPIALTAASRSAQLAVVGSTGYVARVLLHRAGCPIAVVPTHH